MPKVGRIDHSRDLFNGVGPAAPFGNEQTPEVKLKIIGGRPVYATNAAAGLMPMRVSQTLEDSPAIMQSPRGVALRSHYQLAFQDPTGFGASSHKTADVDKFRSHVHSRQDENSSQLNNYPLLPPISSFDAKPSVTDATENKPSANFLTRYPIILREEEEKELKDEIKKAMNGFDMSQLKMMYKELAMRDKFLTGYLHYSVVNLVCLKYMIPLHGDMLRFLFSKCVSPNAEQDHINYEDFLKHIYSTCKENQPAAAPRAGVTHDYRIDGLEHKVEGFQEKSKFEQISEDHHGFYFEPTWSRSSSPPIPPPAPPSPPPPANRKEITLQTSTENTAARDKPIRQSQREVSPTRPNMEDATLLRLLEQNFADSDADIDLDKLRLTFYQMDHERRQTLSSKQIEEVCYKHRIPIQKSILNQLLERCKTGTGQYRWEDFLKFFERLQPIQTGLPIPLSKMPREYARRMPEPGSEWPKKSYNPPSRSTSPQARPVHLPPVARQSESDAHSRAASHIGDAPDLHVSSSMIMPNGANWFTRFMKLAEALYSTASSSNDGFHLTIDEVKRITQAYNMVHSLNLSDGDIENAICQNLMKGKVKIDSFLKSLGKVN